MVFFCSVVASLYGSDVTSRIRVIITDGDSQEIQQLTVALDMVFPNAIRVRCGWHIIDRGLLKNGPTKCKTLKQMEKVHFDGIMKVIKTWLFSWMRPSYCENKREYKISKELLLKYIKSDTVNTVLGTKNVSTLVNFVRRNVEIHEDHFCFYHRKKVRHFGMYSNCAHEGTNNHLKNHTTKVGPRTTLEQCVEILSMNGLKRVDIINAEVVSSLMGRATWSNMECSSGLVKRGAEL